MNIEFPYHLKTRLALGLSAAFAALSIFVAAMLLSKPFLADYSSQDDDYLTIAIITPALGMLLSVVFLVLGLVMRRALLRITETELRIPYLFGAKVYPIAAITSLWIVGKGSRRVLQLNTRVGAGAVVQWMLPNREALDQIHQTLAQMVLSRSKDAVVR